MQGAHSQKNCSFRKFVDVAPPKHAIVISFFARRYLHFVLKRFVFPSLHCQVRAMSQQRSASAPKSYYAPVSPPWMKAQARRLDSAGKWNSSQHMPNEGEWQALYHRGQRDIGAQSSQPGAASSSSRRPTATDDAAARSHISANLLQHRLGGGGNLATSFNPARHTVMIMGRPVQASWE